MTPRPAEEYHLLFSGKGFCVIPSKKAKTTQSTADTDSHQRPDSTDFSPNDMILLQRTIGNQAVRLLLQTPQTKRVHGKPLSRHIQRALIEGKEELAPFDDYDAGKLDNTISTRLNVAFIDFVA